MGYIKTSINLDVNKLKREFDGKLDEAQKKLDELVLRDTNRFIPLEHGDLRKSGVTGGDAGERGGVAWTEDYAIYQYYGGGYEHRDPETDRWFEHSKYLNLKDWLEAIQL
jgi:hypothetical protein